MPHSRSVRRLGAVAAVAVVALTGCSGSSGPAVTASDTTSPGTGLVTKPPLRLPVGDPAPAALARKWVDVHNDQVFLTFRGHGYHLDDGSANVYGRLTVQGRTIWFMTGLCQDGLGEYRWSVQGGRMRLDPVKKDPCPNRADIMNRTYRPA